MRKSRVVSAVALVLVCVCFGSGLSLTSADPTNGISGVAGLDSLTRDASINDGFRLEPNRGAVGTRVKITPPTGGSSSGGGSGIDGQFKQVDAFGEFAIALTKDGLIYSWGDNGHGELGIGQTGGDRDTPQLVKTPSGVRFKQISAGKNHALALSNDGDIWAWGSDYYGQLGIGQRYDLSNVPVKVRNNADGKKFKQVDAGGEHSMAIDQDDYLWGWGANSDGQVGVGYASDEIWDMRKVELRDGYNNYKLRTVDAGGKHTLAIDQDGKYWAWGRNTEHQLGTSGDDSSNKLRPFNRRDVLGELAQISAGGEHSFIVQKKTSEYPIYANGFGQNRKSQVGNSNQNHFHPNNMNPESKGVGEWSRVPFSSADIVIDNNSFGWVEPPYGFVKDINAGYEHSLGIAKDADPSAGSGMYLNWGWGYTNNYQIGSDAVTNQPAGSNPENNIQWRPSRFGKFNDQNRKSNFSYMKAGIGFSVGLTEDGKIRTWGGNKKGQLGDGSSRDTRRYEFSSPFDQVKGPDIPFEILSVKFDGVDTPRQGAVESNGAWNVNAPQPNHTIGSGDLPVDVLVTYKDTNGTQKTTILKYTYPGNGNPAPNPPTPGKCSVRFNLGEASPYVSYSAPLQDVPCGSLAKWPNDANPKWDRHWFNGWKLNNRKTGQPQYWDFNDPVKDNLELVAQWESYSFDMDPKEGPVDGGTDVAVTRSPEDRKGLTYLSVSAGKSHTLAVGSDGYVYSWGINTKGQLGDGTTDNRSVAVRVKTPADRRFLQVSAGGEHSLALDSTGEVWSWGQNTHGQIGNQNTSQQNKPVSINRMSTGQNLRFKQVSAGGEHSLALDSNGDAWAWGYDNYGILGQNRKNTDEWHPVKVQGGVKFTTLSAGYYHSSGVDVNGEVWSWGSNSNGQLGNESKTEEWHPVKTVRNVKPSEDSTGVVYKSVSAGNDYTIALATDGQAWSWGKNSNGQLGIESTTEQWHPVKTYGTTKFNEVSAGDCHTVARRDEDWTLAWGCNTNGRLGIQSQPNVDQWKPQELGVGYMRHVSAGGVHSAIVTFDNTLKTWGDSSPQLGRGDPVSGSPRLAGEINPQFVDLTAVTFEKAEGSTPIWDNGIKKWNLKTPPHVKGKVDVTFRWSVGDDDVVRGMYTYIGKPVTVRFDLNGAPGSLPDQQVQDSQTITWPSSRRDSLCPAGCANPEWRDHWFDGWFTQDDKPWDFNDPVSADNPNIVNNVLTLKAHWDDYKFEVPKEKGPTQGGTVVGAKETSPGDPIKVPNPPAGLRFVQVSAGTQHTLALGADGLVYAWGSNSLGQLGDETTDDSNVPILVHTRPGLRFKQVSAGGSHSLALGTDNKIYSWGWNSNGQLGQKSVPTSGSGNKILIPTAVGDRTYKSIAAGLVHSLAVGTDNEVYGWGSSSDGQVGNQRRTDAVLEPTPIERMGDLSKNLKFTIVAAGGWHSLALDEEGQMWAWGRNQQAQLGNGDNSGTEQWHPVPISKGLGVRFKSISAGDYHSLALDTDGKVWSWGTNSSGQLGDGSPSSTNYKVWKPARIATNVTAANISAGSGFSLANGPTSGWLWSWGSNKSGQLGIGNTTDQLRPFNSTSQVFKSVSAGADHSVAINDKGEIFTFGDNSHIQLGNGTDGGSSSTPNALVWRVVLKGVTFDKDPYGRATDVKPRGDREPGWNYWTATTPKHDPGVVDVILHPNLGDYVNRDNYTFKEYFTYVKPIKPMKLPNAGAVPIARISGISLLTFSSIAGIAIAGRFYMQSQSSKKHSEKSIKK